MLVWSARFTVTPAEPALRTADGKAFDYARMAMFAGDPCSDTRE
jgi:hypothetical protein